MAVKPAKHLTPAAKKKWRKLQQEYAIIDGGGIFLLNVLLEAWDQAAAARKLMDEDGLILENPSTGHKRAHPAAAILKEARHSMFKALSMLGLEAAEHRDLIEGGGW